MNALVRQGKPIRVQLAKELTREIKRGHCWLYSHAIDQHRGPAGSVAMIWDRRGQKQIASGICDFDHPIPIRVCCTAPPFTLDDQWLRRRLEQAIEFRERAFNSSTTGRRLIAGEGDRIPGLVVDHYADTLVLKLDGGAPEHFYRPDAIAEWLVERTGATCVVQRFRGRQSTAAVLAGDLSGEAIPFFENGIRFRADVMAGQKTGFFLDQRDNRHLVRTISHGLRVLNLFSFSGGFSVAAGKGGAEHVTSVDLAPAAIRDANTHWTLNDLPETQHLGVTADCFEFLQQAHQEKQRWDLVICDPPSFAPNEKSRPAALAAYEKLAVMCSKLTARGGYLALASCSSHITQEDFLRSSAEALGKARRSATLLANKGLPIDHPTPLAMPELNYLKFLLFRLD